MIEISTKEKPEKLKTETLAGEDAEKLKR